MTKQVKKVPLPKEVASSNAFRLFEQRYKKSPSPHGRGVGERGNKSARFTMQSAMKREV